MIAMKYWISEDILQSWVTKETYLVWLQIILSFFVLLQQLEVKISHLYWGSIQWPLDP